MGTSTDVTSSESSEPLPPAGRPERRRDLAEATSSVFATSFRSRGVQAGVPDLVQAIGQDVLDQALKKLDRRERLGAVAFGAKGNGAVGDGEQAAIGDADAMGIATQVGEHVLAFFEGGFGVDDPGQTRDARHQRAEAFGVAKVVESREGAVVVRMAQGGHHLAAKDLAEDLDRKEKPVGGGAPPLAIGAQAPGSDERVDVRMEFEFARPRMQHRGSSDGRAVPVLANLDQRAVRGLHQRVEDDAGRKPGEGPQLGGQRKDDVKVPDVQHSLPTRFDPGFLGQRLTLGTMPIAARVVRGVLVSASGALIDMPAEPRGAALRDVGQDTLLGSAQASNPLESDAMGAHDVRDVEARWAPAGPAHPPTSACAAKGPADWGSGAPTSRLPARSARSTADSRAPTARPPPGRRSLARAGASRNCDAARAA